MKIQLDTVNKTITIEEDVNLHEFYEEINAILPSGLWREFTLKVGVIKKFINPITPINPFVPLDPNPSPYTNPYPQIWYTTATDNSNSTTVNSGIYNIKTKA
jgi:hypothetical protein